MAKGFLAAAPVGFALVGIALAFYLWVHTSSW
jgi:hypothetical protein